MQGQVELQPFPNDVQDVMSAPATLVPVAWVLATVAVVLVGSGAAAASRARHARAWQLTVKILTAGAAATAHQPCLVQGLAHGACQSASRLSHGVLVVRANAAAPHRHRTSTVHLPVLLTGAFAAGTLRH
jgi:hypothetical protein